MIKNSGYALAALVLLLGGCREPASPVLSNATYALKTMKGQPLPQVAWESDTFTSFLVGDTLVFQANGTGEERVSYRFEPRGGAELEENGQHEVQAFTYTISGNNVAISLECSGLAQCAPPPHYTGLIIDGRMKLLMTMTESSMRVFEPVIEALARSGPGR